MKHLIALLLAACCFTAQAKDIATMENKAGGKIVLTDVPTETANGPSLIAYSNGSDGSVVWGTWATTESMGVMITWVGDYKASIFNGDDFTILEWQK